MKELPAKERSKVRQILGKRATEDKQNYAPLNNTRQAAS